MIDVFRVLTVILVAVAMGFALAHALELPGTMRLTLIVLLGFIGMQAVYWTVTHPVNKVWLRDQALQGLGADFFAADPGQRSGSQPETLPPDWTAQRDRWEYSHVARAVLGLVSLVAIVVAVA